MKALRLGSALICLATMLLGPTAPPACAQTGWTLVGVRDGLLSRTVQALCSTRTGGLLVGTTGGLNQWDGTRWRQYSAGNGLAEGHITTVVESGGAIYAGSWGGGLSVLRGDTWQTYRAANSPLPSDWIADLAADGETLWIATYGGGLAQLMGGTWTVYRRADADLPSDWLTCLLPDGEGGVWVGTAWSGLAHLAADGRWAGVALPPEAQSHVTALTWRSATPRELWVGTPAGVVRLVADPTGAWRTAPTEAALTDRSVTALVSEADGRMWVGTTDGLMSWAEGRVTRYGVRDGLPHNTISALALDTTGRLWVGTLTAGLAVRGAWEHNPVERLPVVLVHGWRSADSDRLEDSEFRHMATWLREDGFPAYFATGISPANTLHQNATALRQTIDQALLETGAKQVCLIAFSMGGLNARAYLESTLYRGDVARVFTLGSPHQGEDLWLSFLLWEHLAWSDEPSTLELLPAHMSLFNATHAQPGDVPYVLVAGDATLETANQGDSRLPTLFGEMSPSDGLVSTWSALGPETLAGERRLTGDLHAWSTETQLLDLPSLLLPRATYDAHVRPYLFGVGDVPGTDVPMPVDTAYLPADAAHSALRTGTLAPGQSVTLSPLPVDAAGRMRLYLRWKGPALDMTLRDPAGLRRTSENPGDDAEYLELGFADFASYVITDTLQGLWEITLSSPQASRAPSEYVVYAEWPDSSVQLEISSAPQWVQPGEPVTVTATVRGPADLRVGAVTAEVHAPSGRQALALRAEPGFTPGEAVYAATYTPREGGYHSVLITARGRLGERLFERGGYVNVSVRGDGARLAVPCLAPVPPTGVVTDTVPVSVTVAREGDYMLSLELVPEDDTASLVAAHPVHLTPGDQSVAVPLAGLSMRSGVWYRPSRVLLLDISDAGLLLDRADLARLGQGWRLKHD